MLLQLSTAIGALLGTYVSLLAEGMGKNKFKQIYKYLFRKEINNIQIQQNIQNRRRGESLEYKAKMRKKKRVIKKEILLEIISVIFS